MSECKSCNLATVGNELSDSGECPDCLQTQRDDLTAEVARLEKALHKIANYKSNDDDYSNVIMLMSIASEAINPMIAVTSTTGAEP